MRGERLRSGVGGVAVVIVAVAALAAVARWEAGGGAVSVDRIGWADDLTAARHAAAAAGRPVLMDFTAGWCPACQQMARQTWPAAADAVARAGCVPVRVDADAHPELGRQYAVEYLPTLVLTDAAGHELRRSVGFLSADEVRDWLAGKTGP